MTINFKNQANVSYEYEDESKYAQSNIVGIHYGNSAMLEMTTIEKEFRIDDTIVFNISVKNTSHDTLNNVKIEHDLGTYKRNNTQTLTPLTYEGKTALFVDGKFMHYITPAITNGKLVFSFDNIAPNANYSLEFKTRVNRFFNCDYESPITSTATLTADNLTPAVTDKCKVAFGMYADLKVLKNMFPTNVSSGSRITYYIDVYNYGTDNTGKVFVTDDFQHDLIDETMTVTVNGKTVTDYKHADSRFSYPAPDTMHPAWIPGASMDQDDETGFVTVEPSVMKIKISGVLK